AIHSIDKDSTDIVINVLSDDFLAGDRIEHASELTDDQIHKMSAISLNVSTQPSFIYERGDGYLNSDAASRINKLYRLNSLLSAGIVVGASSDCPVTSPDPIKTVYSSVTRQTSSGATVNIEERVTVCEALKMLTTNSVTISGLTQVRDWTDKNLILIDNDLDSCSDEELLQANISWISDFE
ncbi:MAG: amidohydrolase family protein, partial [Chloroflexota bacterium]|nr:amidohydrolase family protein [Chloroflexota bacterium]